MHDPLMLASLREPGCKKSEEEIGKALTGTWREEHLFILKQAVALNEYQKKYEEQQIKYKKKQAAKLGYQLVPVPD